MQQIVQQRLQALRELCRKHRVERLDLFGRRVDLLEREPIENPYLWRSIARSRRALYEAA